MVRFDGGLLAAPLTLAAGTGEGLGPGAQVDGVAVVEPWRDLRWSLCGVLLYDEKQLPHGDEPATCRKCQRYRSATSYLKRREAKKKTAKKT